ncbi:MAG: Rieske 2Fe-2S domain-containing protein [Jatrophihabitans endophyticus]|nr:Rieske 2Fe-2S domain-containing protein [Jatrophihabitans endophyticus]
MPVLRRLAERIEGAEALDPLGEKLNAALSAVPRPAPVEDVLSGTPVGHPLHPALVAVPMGAWVSVPFLDAAGQDDAATRLVGLGLLAAVPTAATGASDWLTTNSAERRVGLVHALLNYAGIGSYLVSWLQRRRGRRTAGMITSTLGLTFVSAAGWLGGHLAYAQGVGVDTTAFESFPEDWTDAVAEADVPADGMASAQVGGVPILLARTGGTVVALGDRCTHRGAPLHEGDLRDGCVHCPWHDSVFALADGEVVSGPATRPQPALETRVRDGRVQVRRVEQRGLRSNVAGH